MKFNLVKKPKILQKHIGVVKATKMLKLIRAIAHFFDDQNLQLPKKKL